MRKLDPMYCTDKITYCMHSKLIFGRVNGLSFHRKITLHKYCSIVNWPFVMKLELKFQIYSPKRVNNFNKSHLLLLTPQCVNMLHKNRACVFVSTAHLLFDTSRPRQNRRHFPETFSNAFLNENVWILLNISLKFVPMLRINNIPASFHIMGQRRSGDTPVSKSMMAISPTHICVNRSQWVLSNDI